MDVWLLAVRSVSTAYSIFVATVFKLVAGI